MKKINLNSLVSVKLTQHGLDIYKSYYEFLNVSCPFTEPLSTKPMLDEDGYWHTQLWNFMRIFGTFMHMSGKPVIVDNDIFIDEIELVRDIPKKMTMDEIEKVLGHKVEIVSGRSE